jgi:hypothetical protein
MSEKKLHKDQIRAYLEKMHLGTLSTGERWQLEKESLDDPFLADALEGYYDSNGDHQSALEKLRDKISTQDERQPKRQIVPLRWLSMAAAVVILLGVSFWLFDAMGHVDLDTNTTAESQSKTTRAATHNKAATSIENNSELNAPLDSKEILITKEVNTADQATPKKQNQAASPQTKSPTTSTLGKIKPISKTTKNQRVTKKKIMAESAPVEKRQEKGAETYADLASEEQEAIVAYDGAAYPIESAEDISKVNDAVAVAEAIELLSEEPMLNAAPETTKAPEPTPPAEKLESKLVLLDINGRALPGVQILDQNKIELGNSDSNGAFTIPEGQPYVIAAFAGHDSLTIASGPNLTVQMKTSADLLGQAHMRLVDMMDDGELIRHYSHLLNALFAKEWPLCPNRNNDFGFFTSSSVYLVIADNGTISDLRFFRNLDTSCEAKISEVLEQAVTDGVFESGRPVNFTFRINL